MIVYLITNLINEKTYVGKTTRSFELRWKEHCSYVEENRYLSRSIRKNGVENFSKEIILECSSIEEMNFIECLWIVVTKSYDREFGYNLTFGGDGLHNPSPQTRKKMSDTHTGSKRTEESIKKQKATNLLRWAKLKAEGFTPSEKQLELLRTNAALMKNKTYEEIYGDRAKDQKVNHSKGLVRTAKQRKEKNAIKANLLVTSNLLKGNELCL